MKKRPQKCDFETECKFLDLPQNEIETACIYEYMRESQALRDRLKEQPDPSVFHHPHLDRLAPYLDRLSRSCRACPREWVFQQNPYRIYCSWCDNAVDLPSDDWVRELFEAGQQEATRFAENRKEKERAQKVPPSFTLGEQFRLISALLKVGFPKPWNLLTKAAQKELVSVIGQWDENRQKSYPSVVIRAGVPEMISPGVPGMSSNIWRLALCEPEFHWPPESEKDVCFFGSQLKRKYFYGFIRIDEDYNQTELKAAFTAWLKEEYAKTKSGGGGWRQWQGKLNDLVVMRLRKRFPNRQDAIKRVEHVAELTTAGFSGCKDWWNNRCKAIKEKLESGVDQRISDLANEEMSRACADALEFFQSYFQGQTPINY
jgi:hypothetical protein